LENPNLGVFYDKRGSMSNEDNKKRVVLVTGASSGLGRSIATLLSEKGYMVFGTSRKPSKGRHSFEMLQLDVTSDKSVKACISTLMKKTGRIDILINNAGYAAKGALEETSIEESIANFETNFFGVIRMVNEVLPIMRKQKEGQIINMGSIAGVIPVPFQGIYAATKAALFAYSQQLRHEVSKLNIQVSIVEPGFFRTEIIGNSSTAKKFIEDYDKRREKVSSRIEEELKKGGEPQLVANEVLKIVGSTAPRFRYPVGKEKNYLIIKRIMPESVFEKQSSDFWLKGE
jgi:short-subunit dehydrogenase